jgi:hypothetical protein
MEKHQATLRADGRENLETAVKDDIEFMEHLTERFMEEYEESKDSATAELFDEDIAKELKAYEEQLNHVKDNAGALQVMKERERTVEDYFRAWLIIVYNTFSSMEWVMPTKMTNHVALQYFWEIIRSLTHKSDDDGDTDSASKQGSKRKKTTKNAKPENAKLPENSKWLVALELFFAVILVAEDVSVG